MKKLGAGIEEKLDVNITFQSNLNWCCLHGWIDIRKRCFEFGFPKLVIVYSDYKDIFCLELKIQLLTSKNPRFKKCRAVKLEQGDLRHLKTTQSIVKSH